MKEATVRSVCECQAVLEATLDEQCHVVHGAAIDRQATRETSPAHSIGAIAADAARFDVGWACPFCGRNTLRSFDRSGLAWREASPAAPAS